MLSSNFHGSVRDNSQQDKIRERMRRAWSPSEGLPCRQWNILKGRFHGRDQSRRTTNHLLGCWGSSHEWSRQTKHVHDNNEIQNDDATFDVEMARPN